MIEFIDQGESDLLLRSSDLRLTERAESPTVKAFALHPGSVPTDIAQESGLIEQGMEMPDPAELPAYTMLYLSSGKADWLSGRYVESTWDLGQVEREWKEKILTKDLLVNKLDVVA